MKKVFLSVFFLIFVLCVLIAESKQQDSKQTILDSARQISTPQVAVQPAMTPEQFNAKISELINKRRQVSRQMHELRVKVIKEDVDLRILHKTILDLHTKMAKQLNANPKIVPLMDKGREIDSEIEKLINNYQAGGNGK